MKDRSAKVITTYRTPYPKGCRVPRSTEVTKTDRESRYPGWVWCRVASRTEGWLPIDILQVDE